MSDAKWQAPDAGLFSSSTGGEILSVAPLWMSFPHELHKQTLLVPELLLFRG